MALNTLDWGPTTGEMIGRGLGSGLGEGLQQLANMKMQDYAQRNQLALQQQAKMQDMQRQHDLLEQTLGPGWGKIAYMPEKMGLMAIQGGWNPTISQTGMQQNLQTLVPADQVASSAGLQGPAATSDLAQAIQQGAYNTPQMKQARELQANQQAFTAGENVKKRGFEEAQSRRKESIAETEKAHAESAKMYEADQNSARAAEQDNEALDSMIELTKSGTLPSGAKVKFINSLASTPLIGSFINPTELIGLSAEQYEKKSTSLMRNVSKITGGRVPVAEWNTWLKTIPTLMNTPEGQITLAEDKKIFNDMVIARAKVENEIMKEYGDKRPRGFERMVDERYRPYAQDLSKRMIKNIRKGLYTTGSKVTGLPDPKMWPSGKGLIDSKGRRLQVIDGQWKEFK